ncbi:flagellar basal body protein [Selenomonas sp.]|uniref:flagellar basal body protein n=1 Tax=Selenomonas sp. TaxID=2053611 RepID=UPI003A102EAF
MRKERKYLIMMHSLFSGVSGLKSHQTRMDVIGNNIANVRPASNRAARRSRTRFRRR